MTTPTVTQTRRNGNPLGERVELARYTIPAGERILYGQHVNGIVRFLPEEPIVLDSALGSSEKSGCCPPEPLQEDGSSSPARQKRANDDGGSAEAADATTPRRGRTGPRVELARYSIPAGDRVLHGQRVDGVVRFLPEDDAALEGQRGSGENGSCRPREQSVGIERADAARPKRPNGHKSLGEPHQARNHSGATGRRVELARYRISAGERALYGQRVDGVVRLTDVPLAPGGRAYLVERGLEEEGANANAALQALIADYLSQAAVLDDVPMATTPVSLTT